MQPSLRSNVDLRRSLIPCVIVVSALAIVAALAGADRASGQEELEPMQPFPITRFVGQVRRTGAKVTLVTVKGPTASRLVTRCRPSSKCPYSQRTRLIPGPEGSTRTVRIEALQRIYRAGTTLRVYVAKPGFVGRYTSFSIRRGKPPKRYDRCVLGLELEPVGCPAS